VREENITKAIIFWLEENGWEIICYDFPQSGTGKVIHPNGGVGLKNKDSIIPDVVAIKKNIVIFCENKDRFFLSDFEKLQSIKLKNNYSNSITKLLLARQYSYIYYGVVLPINQKNRQNFKRQINF